VAVAVRPAKATCDRVLVWTPSAGQVSSYRAQTFCPGSGGRERERVAEVGLAGTRVAWVEAYQGKLLDLVLVRATLGSRVTVEVARAESYGGADGIFDGDYLGNLHGDGSLLAYNAWSICTAVPPGFVWDGPRCEAPGQGTEPTPVVENARLLVLGREAPLLEGPAFVRAVSVDAGRVAMRQDAGVAVLGADGSVLATIPLPPDGLGAALSGGQLAVERPGAIEVYDLESGLLTETLAVPGGARLTDLEGGFAVYVADGTVHVVRVATGQDVAFSPPRERVVDAELEREGLSYAHNPARGKGGRVVFVTFKKVVARFGPARRPASAAQATAFAQSP
jgi:hypothetical protein